MKETGFNDLVHKVSGSCQSSGFGLIEFVVAMGIFLVIAVSGVTTVVRLFTTNRLGSEEDRAAFYVQEGIEAVRSIRNQGWNSLFLQTDCSTGCGLDSSGGNWTYQGSSDSLTAGGGRNFTRVLTVTKAQRDASCNIVETGGTPDSDIYKVTSTVSWPFSPTRQNSISLTTYLAQWDKVIEGVKVAYYDNGNRDLKYAECDANCTTASNWTSVVVDSNGDVGKSVSMVLDSLGAPRVLYYDKNSKGLKYAECDANCTTASNWTKVMVDTNGDPGQVVSLDINTGDGLRAAYYTKGAGDVVYAECDANCTTASNWTSVVVDSNGDVGKPVSLALDGNGRPRLATYEKTNGDLKYAECDANCTTASNWTSVVVDSNGDVGKSLSISVGSVDAARIAYYDKDNQALKYAECNSACINASNWVSVAIDASGDTGQAVSIILEASNPRIAYYDKNSGDLKYTQCDANCTTASNWTSVVVDSNGDVGKSLSIMLKNGQPGIAYYDKDKGDVKYAERQVVCSSVNWVAGIADSSGDVGKAVSAK